MDQNRLVDSPDDPIFQDSLNKTDTLVLEYLLYRGFTRTFRSLALDRRRDRIRCFEVDSIIDSLFGYVEAYDLAELRDLWNFLEARFFFHLDSGHMKTAEELRTRLERYYLVHAMQTGRRDAANCFFMERGAQLHGQGNDWKDWFALPFLPDPANEPYFKFYFTPQWREHLRASLSNFLSLILFATPIPQLLKLRRPTESMEHVESKESSEEGTKELLTEANHKVSALILIMKDMVGYIHRESIDTSRRLPVTRDLFKDDHEKTQRLALVRATGERLIQKMTKWSERHEAVQPSATDGLEDCRPTGTADDNRGVYLTLHHRTKEEVDNLVKEVREWMVMLTDTSNMTKESF